MNIIRDQTFDQERALYNIKDTIVDNCKFSGPQDGESFLKECSNIKLINSFLDLRYPMWHNTNLEVNNCNFTLKCRASIWYCDNVNISDSNIEGVKAIRECKNVTLNNLIVNSPEFFWKNDNGLISNCKIQSDIYGFFMCKNLKINNLNFEGKYSFQYCKNIKVNNSVFNTKDAFWHSKNVTVKDSIINGEYLGWYSYNLTLINCKIVGTQPLCYCKNLKLINCTTQKCDLSFEYSSLDAKLVGHIISIKNPLKGNILVDSKDEIITTNNKYKNKSKCKIIIKNK